MRRQRPSLNITEYLETVVADLCARIPEFAHIQPERILVCLSRTRRATAGGTFAKIVPMRFPDGTPFKVLQDGYYALPQIPSRHGDILYLVYVYFPRYFEQPFERRLLTLVHELYHIDPAFDGTIRRIGNRAHGASRERYNANLEPLITRYLAKSPSHELLRVLRTELTVLVRDVTLVGRGMPLPRAIRLR